MFLLKPCPTELIKPPDCPPMDDWKFSEKADAFLAYIPKNEDWLTMKYTKVCPYCRTDPKKDTCVNCGAPQEGN